MDFRDVITTVADATVSGNEAELGGVYNLDTFNNDGDVSGNSPDDIAP